MTRIYGTSLIFLLMAASAFPAGESASPPQVATVTGEIRNPTSRELVFTCKLPSALEDLDQDVALDSLNRFAFEVPVVRGTVVSGRYEGRGAEMGVGPVAGSRPLRSRSPRLLRRARRQSARGRG